MESNKKSLKTLSSCLDKLERANSIQERLNLLVEQTGNPNSFAKLTGLSVSGLKRYLNGGEPTASKIIQIGNSIGVNPAWLLTGKGSIAEDSEGNGVSNERFLALLGEDKAALEELNRHGSALQSLYGQINNQVKSELTQLSDMECAFLTTAFIQSNFPTESIDSLIAKLSANKDEFRSEFALIPGYRIQVSAGNGSLNGDDERPVRHLAFRRKWLKYKGFSEKDLTVVWAKGDSMQPTINDNDTLIVHLGRKEPKDGYIYVFRNGDELFVKRYQSILGAWRLISDNALYSPIDIPKEEQHQFEVIGQVVHVAKDIAD